MSGQVKITEPTDVNESIKFYLYRPYLHFVNRAEHFVPQSRSSVVWKRLNRVRHSPVH